TGRNDCTRDAPAVLAAAYCQAMCVSRNFRLRRSLTNWTIQNTPRANAPDKTTNQIFLRTRASARVTAGSASVATKPQKRNLQAEKPPKPIVASNVVQYLRTCVEFNRGLGFWALLQPIFSCR